METYLIRYVVNSDLGMYERQNEHLYRLNNGKPNVFCEIYTIGMVGTCVESEHGDTLNDVMTEIINKKRRPFGDGPNTSSEMNGRCEKRHETEGKNAINKH